MEQRTEASNAPLADFLCFSVYSASHAFNRLYRPMLDELGLTYPQYLVMQLLWAKDGRSVKDIGEALRLESNTLTPLLKRLQANGLIERSRDERDERVVRVVLTERGAGLRADATSIPDCVSDTIGLDGAELSKLTTMLEGLRDRLNEAAEKND